MAYTIATKPEDVGRMPNQIYGEFRGRPFYFRARHGSWILRFVDGEEHDYSDTVAFGGGEPLGLHHALPGWWEPEDAFAFVDELLRQLDKTCDKGMNVLDALRDCDEHGWQP